MKLYFELFFDMVQMYKFYAKFTNFLYLLNVTELQSLVKILMLKQRIDVEKKECIFLSVIGLIWYELKSSMYFYKQVLSMLVAMWSTSYGNFNQNIQ